CMSLVETIMVVTLATFRRSSSAPSRRRWRSSDNSRRCRWHRGPPGALPSSLLGYEALTGSLDDSRFEDYLHRLNQDCEHIVLLRQFCRTT
ncbi:hypothetical protein ACJX0J_030437, partial [Zea mays]